MLTISQRLFLKILPKKSWEKDARAPALISGHAGCISEILPIDYRRYAELIRGNKLGLL